MNFYLKSLLTFFLFLSLSAIAVHAQTITVTNFDNSIIYSPGSSIGVPVTITNTAGNCIPQGNTFNLYLSNAAGVFSATPTLIGTVSAFYIDHINGVIPAGTLPGAGYRVKVVSTANPGATIVDGGPFTITAGATVNAQIITTTSAPLADDVFGVCNNPQTTFTLDYQSSSTTGTTGSVRFYDQTGTFVSSNNSLSGSFVAQQTSYTAVVRAGNGVVNGTKAYTIVNNTVNNNIGNSSITSGCLANSSASITLSYSIATNPLLTNYPGNTYLVSWGDGTPSTSYTLCELLASGGTILHTYKKTSCGAGNNNLFQITVSPVSPICGGKIGTDAQTFARVTLSPVNRITAPVTAACSGPVTFTNSSYPGEDPASTTGACHDFTGARYNWFVDGVLVRSNVSIGTAFTPTLTSGHHTISLVLINNPSVCPVTAGSYDICIQDPPAPSFTVSSNIFCASAGVIITNTSVIDATCAPPVYNWAITPSVPTNGGTDLHSAEPKFAFSTKGIYTLTLSMPDACGINHTAAPVTLKVDESTALTLSPDVSFCGPQSINFNATSGPGQTIYSGTADAATATYNWAINASAGAAPANFITGTVTSQYPTINFPGFGSYAVTVTYTNSCGTISKTQNITIQKAPAVSVGPNSSVCASTGAYALAGSISDMTNVTGYQWKTNGDGTFNNSTSTLTPVYTLGTNDKRGGNITITLDVKTNLVGTCADVPQAMTLTVVPADIVTSPATAAVCSGNMLNYVIGASQAGSTFTWTATAPPNITGYTGGGIGSPINDVLVNSDPINPGVVVYTITPSAGGCTGTPFNLTVTVNPNPALTLADATICSNKPAGITLGGSLKYKWTSVVTNGSATGNTQQATYVATTGITEILKNTGITPAVVKYTIIPISAAGCPGSPVDVNITIQAPPTQPVFTPATGSICNLTSFTLNGTVPVIGTGLWTETTGKAVTFADATSPSTIVSGLVPGTVYNFAWTISTSCLSNTANFTLTDDVPSVGGTAATTPGTVCYNSSGTITLTGKTGNVAAWQTSTDGGTTWTNISGINTGASYNYVNLTTTTSFRAIVVNGSCTVDYSSPVTVTVVPQAVLPNAGIDQTFCNQTVTTLQGNSTSGLSGLWTLKSGPSAGLVIIDPSSPTTTVTGLQPGSTYVFSWSISSSCATNTDDVVIKDDALSDGGTAAAAPGTVCYGASGTITLTGNVGTVSAWQQSTDGGTNWITIAGTNGASSYNYSNITLTTSFRAVVISGSCSSATSVPVTVTVIQPAAVANAGPNQNLCNQSNTTLAGNNPGSSPGLWTLVSGPAAGLVITDPSNPTTTVTGLVSGNVYVFAWTISNSCGATQATVQITDDLLSNGGTATTANNTVCYGSNGTVNVSGIVGSLIAWQQSTDNGTTWQTVSGTNTNTTYAYNNLTQATAFRAVVVSGSCAVAYSSQVNIAVNPPTVIPDAGPDQVLCNETTVTLQGNSPGLFTGMWTLKSGLTAGVIIANPNSPNTTVSGLVGGNVYTFTWTIFGQAPCTNLSDDVVITNQSAITNTISVSGSGSVCAGATVNIIGSTPTGGVPPYSFKWESSIDNGVTWATIAAQTGQSIIVAPTVNTQYRRTVLSNGQLCSFVSSPVSITTQPALANNTVTTTSTIVCFNTSPNTITGSTPTGGDGMYFYTWSQSTDGINFTDIPGANGKDYQPGPLKASTAFRRSVTTTLCAGAMGIQSNTVTINTTPELVAKFTASTTNNCAPFNINSTNVTATPDNNAQTYTWYAGSSVIGTGLIFPGYSITGQGVTVTIKLVVTSKLSCPDATYSLDFSTSPQATASLTADKTVGCGPTDVTFTNTSTPLNGSTYTWHFDDGTPDYNGITPPTHTFQPDAQGRDAIYTVKVTANGCSPNSASQTITVYPAVPKPIIDPGSLSGCSPYTITVHNLTLGTNKQYDYYLYDEHGIIAQHILKTDKADVVFNAITTTNTTKIYTVYMIATGPCGATGKTNVYPITITPSGITAKMTVTPQNSNGVPAGCAPFLATFHNLSTGGNQYYFNVYDSSFKVVDIIPAPDQSVDVNYNFAKPGAYYVDVSVVSNCTATPVVSVPQVQVIVYPVPAPNFTANATSGCVQLTTTFTNTTPDVSGNPASSNTYTWDFGDGSPVSHAFSPTHTYTYSAKPYTVSLTALNPNGCTDQLVKTQFINVYPPPSTDFTAQPDTVTIIPNYTFAFVDQSKVPGVSWLWDFGDKTTSTRQNPSHTYLDTGSYKVTLTSYTQYGCTDTKLHMVRINGVPGQLYVPNAFLPTSLTPELRVFTVKGSGLKSWHMRIFNIWGQLVFETTALNSRGEPTEFWDGKIKGIDAQQGGYAWEISATFINGTDWKGMSYNGGSPKRAGMLNLIR